MTEPNQATARPAPTAGAGRRIAAAILMSAVVFLVLWVMAFSLVVSLLISSCCGLVLIAASTVSDVVEMVLDAIATVIFAIFAAIAAVIAAIFGLFS